jgi:hypothetical protein
MKPGLIIIFLLFSSFSQSQAERIILKNAQAPAGGSDTVKVFVTTDKAYPAAEIIIKFNPDKLFFQKGSFMYNQALWKPEWGSPVYSDFPNGFKVAFISLSNREAFIAQADSLNLFSVVLRAASGLAPGDTSAVQARGMLTNSEFQEIEFEPCTAVFTIIKSPARPKSKK